jgi:hypothetical protein
MAVHVLRRRKNDKLQINNLLKNHKKMKTGKKQRRIIN